MHGSGGGEGCCGKLGGSRISVELGPLEEGWSGWLFRAGTLSDRTAGIECLEMWEEPHGRGQQE